MDEPRNEPGTTADPPPLCNRFSDQIIGMTFGEEKAMLEAASPKPASATGPRATRQHRPSTASPETPAAPGATVPAKPLATASTIAATEPVDPADSATERDG
jgi:hypothetical protein